MSKKNIFLLITFICLSAVLLGSVVVGRRIILEQTTTLKSEIQKSNTQINQLQSEIVALEEEQAVLVTSKSELENQLEQIKQSSKDPVMISHRGYNDIAPENNLQAFKAALADGFSELEMDVWFTKDNVPVLSHEKTINRIARNLDGSEISETLTIPQLTLQELYQFDFGVYKGQEFAGTKITTLDELFQYASTNDKIEFMHIELKHVTSIDQKRYLVDLADKYHLRTKVGWQSFIWTDLYDFNTVAPEMQLEVLGGEYSNNMYQTVLNLDNGQRKVVFSLHSKVDSAIKAVSTGYDVLIWIVNDELTIKSFKDIGVKGIMTNGSKSLEYAIKGEALARSDELQKQITDLDNQLKGKKEQVEKRHQEKEALYQTLLDLEQQQFLYEKQPLEALVNYFMSRYGD